MSARVRSNFLRRGATMPKPESQTLPNLEGKLAFLFAHGTRVRNQADLAAYFEAAASTVTGWIHGIKGKPGGRVRPDILDGLCLLLSEETRGMVDEVTARRLWLGTLDDFKTALLSRPDLLEVLRRLPQNLPVRYVPFDPSAIGMVDDVVEVPEGSVMIGADWRIAFEVDGRVGHRLVVLLEQDGGWRVIGPGHRHTGRIDEAPERVPDLGDAMFRYSPPLAPHRYVFIELPADFEPSLARARGIAALKIEAFADFARQLLHRDIAGRWRWAQAAFHFPENAGKQAD